jgi:hypothetical protein
MTGAVVSMPHGTVCCLEVVPQLITDRWDIESNVSLVDVSIEQQPWSFVLQSVRVGESCGGGGHLDSVAVETKGVECAIRCVGEGLEQMGATIDAEEQDLVQPAQTWISWQAAIIDIDLRIETPVDTTLEEGDEGCVWQTLVDVLYVEPGTLEQCRLAQMVGGRPGVNVKFQFTVRPMVELYEGGKDPRQTGLAVAGEDGQWVGVEQITLHQWWPEGQ